MSSFRGEQDNRASCLLLSTDVWFFSLIQQWAKYGKPTFKIQARPSSHCIMPHWHNHTGGSSSWISALHSLIWWASHVVELTEVVQQEYWTSGYWPRKGSCSYQAYGQENGIILLDSLPKTLSYKCMNHRAQTINTNVIWFNWQSCWCVKVYAI